MQKGTPRRSIRSTPCSTMMVLPLVMLVTTLCACSSTSRVTFLCDHQVNDGIVLTIDLIEVADDEVQQIQSAGRDWFYSPLRREMAHRIKTVTVKGDCDTTVDLSKLGAKEKVLRKRKGYGTLAIIAEYKSSYDRGHMRFLPYKQWKGKTFVVRVHNINLTIDG